MECADTPARGHSPSHTHRTVSLLFFQCVRKRERRAGWSAHSVRQQAPISRSAHFREEGEELFGGDEGNGSCVP